MAGETSFNEGFRRGDRVERMAIFTGDGSSKASPSWGRLASSSDVSEAFGKPLFRMAAKTSFRAHGVGYGIMGLPGHMAGHAVLWVDGEMPGYVLLFTGMA
jgi:hypothetical protein